MSGVAVYFIRSIVLMLKVKQQGGYFINEGERINVYVLKGLRKDLLEN